MTFNEKLIRLRRIKGLTQDELASAVSVSRQAVYKWESGQSYPEVPKLLLIKELFGISIDDLLDESFEVEMPEIKKKRASKKVRQRAIEQVEAEATEAVPVEAAPVQTEQLPQEEAVEQTAEAEEAVPAAVAALESTEAANEEQTVEETSNVVAEEIPTETAEAPAHLNEQSENTVAKTEAQTTSQDDKKRGLFSRLFGRR